MSAVEKITADDLLDAMAEAEVLEVFCRLPRRDQEKFSGWIGKAGDDASHWRRIHALILALKAGPLQATELRRSVYYQGGRG